MGLGEERVGWSFGAGLRKLRWDVSVVVAAKRISAVRKGKGSGFLTWSVGSLASVTIMDMVKR